MASMTSQNGYQLQIASSNEEVEQLVRSLYSAGSSRKIGQIQETLQRLQRSPEGWRLADALLSSDDDKVRFFGALTFTIKINQDWDSLGPEDAKLLLIRLLSRLVRLVSQNEGSLVVRKICSALVAYFVRPNSAWEHCLRHVICSFHSGQAVSTESLSVLPSTGDLIPGLSQLQAIATLWFSSMLVEEISKTDNTNMQTHKYYERVGPNLQDAVTIMRHFLMQTSQDNARVCQEGIKCFQSWVDYAHRAWIDTAAALDPLREITPLVITYMILEKTSEVTVECLTDILTNFCAFLSGQDLRSLMFILCGEVVQQRIALLKDGNFDSSSVAHGRLLLAFGDVTVQDLAKDQEDPNSQLILHMLHGLLTCEGYAVAEDEICASALEFWNTFTEFMIDSLFAEGEIRSNWIDPARNHVLRAIEECWVKIRFPTQEEAESWDSEVRIGFKAFRADVKDLLQASYTLLGVGILDKFADLALISLERRDWVDLESTLFCLNALSDCTADEESVDLTLERLFGSPLFMLLSNNEVTVPAKTRQTAVYALGHYTAFFERHTRYLAQALNFLFTGLQAPALAIAASKSISALCSSCRKALIGELGTFIQQYETFLAWPSADISSKEKVIGAIAAIVQAVPAEEEKIESLNRLLLFVEADLHSCLRLAGAGHLEDAQVIAYTTLRCLASMGKALQAPDDLPIDLDGDVSHVLVWNQGHGASIQARIVHCLEVISDIFRNDGEIVEAACDVLRTGYKETIPGPFVFTPQITINFVNRIQTPPKE
ncbi:MAG: hypothetical protein M1830_008787 [Pleopsidium flavum]|nr:MAG: hypothetical protein M1830_008787 [Pleopsidium flavum]